MTSTQEFLIIGADGFIGSALAQELRRRGSAPAVTSRRVPTGDNQALPLDLSGRVDDWTPPLAKVAFFTAAVSSVAACERDPALARAINVDNTVAVAKKLIANGTRVIYLSSNAVFDGEKPYAKITDPVSPKNIYGRHKADAEKMLLALNADVLIVRLTKIASSESPVFKKWLQELRNGNPVEAYSDMVVAPVSLTTTVDVLIELATQSPKGILHLSGDVDIPYDQAARHLAKKLNRDENLVSSIAIKQANPAFATWPRNTTLDMSETKRYVSRPLPTSWQTLDGFVG